MVEQREVVIKDIDVESAIKEGLEILDSNREDVEIIIMEEGKKGFLGLGSSLAKVKLKTKEKAIKSQISKELSEGGENNADLINESSDSSQAQESDDSMVFIEDGYVKLNGAIDDKYPIIYSDNRIQLYQNEQLVEDSVIMLEDDQIKIELDDQEAKSEIKIRTSADNLQAFILLVQESGIEFVPEIIPDSKSSGKILISAKESEKITPPKIKVEDVERRLDELGIVYGINREALAKALANPNQEFLIAEGQAPQEGTDGWIEYLFKESSGVELEKEQDQVDYFSLNQINSVQQGEIIAVKHSPKPGEAGCDVFGNQIEIEEVETADWEIGEGVKTLNNQAIATKAGRPVVQASKLYISETYVINGNVDSSIGNIDFDGNVIIKGEVKENFSVNAGGKIEVLGNVNQASLNAYDGIIAHGNVIGSKLATGELSAFYKEIYSYLKRLEKLFTEMEQAIRQLKEHKSFKTQDLQEHGARKIIQLLLDTKYSEITQLLRKLYKASEEVDWNRALDDVGKLLSDLKKLINENGLAKINNLKVFTKLKKDIGDIYKKLAKFDFESSDIVAKYIQSSQLVANGNIIVDGKGVYNSNFNAGAGVRVKGQPGCFRGGEVKAEENVFIKELGSPGGSKVSVYVPQDKNIEAEQVHINVLLNIGGYKHRFQKNWGAIVAHINNKGNIVFT